MNKKLKTILIISIAVFGSLFSVNPVQAEIVQFGDKQIFVDSDGLPFNLSNWAPGMSAEKTIKITNNESFGIDVFLQTSRNEPMPGEGETDVADVLTLTVGEQSKHISELFTKRMQLASINAGKYKNYDLNMSFDQGAGNDYQGKTINFDFLITVEEKVIGGTSLMTFGAGGYTPPPPPPPPTTDTGEVTATSGEGGITTLTNPDGNKIELTIPPGAVSENTNFSINLVDISSVNQPDPGAGYFLIAGLVFEIQAQADGEFITTFGQPLTLTFHYTDEQIEGLDENSLQIYYWDKTLNQWVAIENSEVNIDNNTVTVSIDHFTLFALIGSKIKFIEEKKPPEEIGITERIKEIPKRITEEIKKITEGIIPSAPTAEAEKPLGPEGIAPPEGAVSPKEGIVTVPPEKRASEGGLAPLLLASLGVIRETAWMAIVVVFCLIGLVVIGIREWELARKKKKNIS